MKQKQKIRESFRLAVFGRDKFTCKGCGERKPEVELDAHHITDRNQMPNGGYVVENGITLCNIGGDSCHRKAEQYHVSNGSTWIPGFHPNDLYEKIGSSKEKAIEASLKTQLK